MRILFDTSVLVTAVVRVVHDALYYTAALERVATLGLASGVVYDALHLACAERHGCARLYTYNVGDFTRLVPRAVKVLPPGE